MLMIEPLDEQAVIAPLLRYPCFRRFWRRERSRVTTPIQWARDPDYLSDGGALQTRDGATWIVLRSLPPDPHTVAHEVMHVRLDELGYPSIGVPEPNAPPPLRVLAIELNMILDLPVEAKLRTLGFTPHPLATLAQFERNLARLTTPATGARFRQIAEATGYMSPGQCRRFFTQALRLIRPGALVLVEHT